MDTEITRQKIVRIVFHLCFITSIILLFRYNSIVRPMAEGYYYKEFLSALFLIIMLYVNYLFIIPTFFLKRKFVVFLLLSLMSVVITTFVEMALVAPNITSRLQASSLSGQEIRLFILMDSFTICGRNMAFLLFFLMIKILENEREIRDNEQLTLAKSKGFISVSTKDSIKYISLSEIFYIIHEKNYCYIHTQNGNNYSKYISLMKMDGYLPENLFIRINRNIIINKNNIVSCTKEEVTIYSDYSGEEKIFTLSEKFVPNMREKISSAGGLNRPYGGLNSQNGGLKDRFGGLNEGIDMANLEEFMDNIAHNEDLLILCQIIAKDPSVTMKSLSDQLGVSLKTVERRIKILKDKGILQHSGAKKNGEYVFAPSISVDVLNCLTSDEPVDGDSVVTM